MVIDFVSDSVKCHFDKIKFFYTFTFGKTLGVISPNLMTKKLPKMLQTDSIQQIWRVKKAREGVWKIY